MQILALDQIHNRDCLLRTKAEMVSHLSYLVLLKAKHSKQINKTVLIITWIKIEHLKKYTEF